MLNKKKHKKLIKMPDRFKVTKSDTNLEEKDTEASVTDKFLPSPTSPGKFNYIS